MKIYKIFSLLGLCYVYSMNPVDGELTEEVEIVLPEGYREVGRTSEMRGIACPSGYIATMFSGPDATVYEYLGEGKGKYCTFSIAS